MKKLPKNDILNKAVQFARSMKELRVPLYAANASFFIVLSVFPALVLLLGLLRFTPLDVGRLGEIFYGILPRALAERAQSLIMSTYEQTTGLSLSLSAVATLWSAGKGVHGVMTGLNGIYGIREERGYIRTRLISMCYTVALFLVLILTLALHVFGTNLLELLKQFQLPVISFLSTIIDFRFFLLLAVQTAVFTAMFKVMPNQRIGIRDSLPGALLASGGWLIFSDLFSIYVEHSGTLSTIYGPIYTVALAMLWLYFCMSIVFYGGALNCCLMKYRQKENVEKM